MRNILVYIEPHPIRNYFEEFYDVGQILCDGMLQLDKGLGYQFRYFSNDAIVDRLVTERAALSYLSMRFTADENETLESFYKQWNEESIQDWLSLVKGTGPISDFYVSVLSRIREEYAFDAILLWSDNGAVRRFGEINGIPVLHAEFGPTRSPFHKTVYFDPQGTNGAAAVLNAPLDELVPAISVPRETWVTREGKVWNDQNKVGLIDAPLTLDKGLVAKGVFSGPFVFIPLQLQDDLNTQLYSEFKTPEAFLQYVIPKVLAAGFRVVIKGHPAAGGRTYNLIAETKALKYAKSLEDGVTIIPRDTPALQSINVIAQAAAVLTINSSVGFEAILLGKNSILFGNAAFDIGGKLQATPDEFTSLITQSDNEHSDKLASFLCNHYLHPLEAVTNGNAIATVFDYIFESQSLSTHSKEFWQGWISKIQFGYDWLSESTQEKEDLRSYRYAGNLVGNRLIFESGSRTHFIKNDQLVVQATYQNTKIFANCKHINNSFIGFIESTEDPADDTSKFIKISGWALDLKGYRPPVQILFCSQNRVLSTHRILTIRRDVADFLGKRVAPKCGFTFEIDKKHIDNNDCYLIFLSTSNFAYRAPLKVGSITSQIN
ncbi:hypothetical protein [Pseudomonas sp. N2-11]|uniref:capsular polysaccharide export protein, LipB/KpsS family n=1 Tax=Pseudomonas sp. N2-11 TaxID=2962038 RepID=UPI0020B78612|nr:hypothetical protein [Pseudomonas sp. N2-11]MCP3792512.1 hypothetical protein [Pseudomonas sp. N2-11]